MRGYANDCRVAKYAFGVTCACVFKVREAAVAKWHMMLRRYNQTKTKTKKRKEKGCNARINRTDSRLGMVCASNAA